MENVIHYDNGQNCLCGCDSNGSRDAETLITADRNDVTCPDCLGWLESADRKLSK